MPRIRFCYVNRFGAAGATVVASSAATNLPAAAAKNPDRSYPWRSATGIATPTLDVDFGAVAAVSLVAIANPVQFRDDAFVEIYERGDSGTAGSATQVATLPLADTQSRVSYITFATQSHRHWQLKWTNPGSNTGPVEAGYVFMGVPYEPTVNYVAPAEHQAVDPSIPVFSVDGQVTVTRRRQYRRFSLVFDFVPEADFDAMRALFQAVGTHTPFFVSLDSNRAWSTTLVRFMTDLGSLEEVAYGRWTVMMQLEEVR